MKENMMTRLCNSRISPFAVLGGLGLIFIAMPAFAATDAKTLGEMTNSFYDATISLQVFLSVLSYTLGAFFSVTGLRQLKDHVDDPNRTPVRGSLFRIAAATFFIFAPTLANLLVASIGGGEVGSTTNLLEFKNTQTINASTGGDGLDGALIRFVIDIAEPFLDNMLPFFCYVLGVIFMLIGLKRLALANGEGPQAPGGLGTMGTFMVASFLLSFGYIMYVFNISIFGGDGVVYSNPLVNTSNTDDLTKRANQAMWGVFIFLRIVGYISVLRGLFMLRASGEGQNVSMTAVGTHLIAGALLANGTAFVLAAQSTFVKDPADYVLKPF